MAKDPRWALEVLRILRQSDKRYRLHLVGGGLNATSSPALHRYHQAFTAELDPLVAEGAVRVLGHTDDVPGALTDVGTVLSTSVREGWPLSIMEGAASGAVPVVRDWPFFAGKTHGARSLFPSDWVWLPLPRRPSGF